MRRWPSLQHFIAAALLGVVAVPVLVLAYVNSGAFNVAAAHPHSRLVEWLTHETMIHSVRLRAPQAKLPPQLTYKQAMSGFCQYDTHCVGCHGAAAVARQQWVNGLNPQPPYLLDSGQHWSPGELYWIVRNGIKMTGMPAWRESMSDAQIRDTVLFLEAMQKLPPQTYRRWRAANVCRKS